VYVQASLLRLRVAPDPDAAWSPLPINSKVRVVDHQGEWMRVIAADGRSGWVHHDYVGDAPLTRETVQQRFDAATDPADKVVWAERAAALSPADSGVLKTLVDAYERAGRPEDASKVREVLAVDESDRFDRWFATHKTEAATITAALDQVRGAEELVDLWQRARDLTAAMAEPLSRGYDPVQHSFPDGDPTPMLQQRLPWATVALYAEGTVPALELLPSAWTGAAARTPEAWDDAFFGLVTAAYENASARGWTKWQRRTWDYGGCSVFGDGGNLELSLLLRTDDLAGVAPVAPYVAEIRSGILADIVDKPATSDFPYCTAPGQETPLDGLLAEANAILAQVHLADDERSRLEARMAANFGR
jgi:hypothetical protein